jgi:hypothetical protein
MIMIAFLLLCACFLLMPARAEASCANPGAGWIACEDFEDGGQGWNTWYNSSIFVECNGCISGQENPARILLTNAPSNVHGGQWALYMPAAASAGYRGASLTFRSCSGTKRSGCTLTGYEKLHFRAWVKLAQDHQYVHHFLAVSGCRPDRYWETDGNAGCRPNGARWAGTTLDFNNRHELFFYTYYPGMRCDQGGYCSGTYAQNICDGCAAKNMPCDNGLECCWGNLFRPASTVVLPRGEWVCLEIMMQLNSVGSSDGEMAFWINDSLALHVTGMHWRDVPELQLNKAWLQHYIASGDATQSNRVWFDDVVVSTQKIGMGTSIVRSLPAKRSEISLNCFILSSRKVLFSAGLAEAGAFSIRVFDVSGRKVWNYRGNSGTRVVWKLSKGISSGVYLAELRSGNRRVSQKILIWQ